MAEEQPPLITEHFEEKANRVAKMLRNEQREQIINQSFADRLKDSALESGKVYVDALVPCARSKVWRYDHSCHLFVLPGDGQLLASFAVKIGLRLEWFQNKAGSMPHFDLNKSTRYMAVKWGAVEVGRWNTCWAIREWRSVERRAL